MFQYIHFFVSRQTKRLLSRSQAAVYKYFFGAFRASRRSLRERGNRLPYKRALSPPLTPTVRQRKLQRGAVELSFICQKRGIALVNLPYATYIFSCTHQYSYKSFFQYKQAKSLSLGV